MSRHVRVSIVGAGFSGIAAAISLRRAGITDIAIIDRADRVGGAWTANTYPGCACDVPSRLYELDAAPWPDWSRKFAGQAEIQRYLEQMVLAFGLGPMIELNTELISSCWDQTEQRWCTQTSTGEITSDYAISACGGLTEPLVPDIEGVADFNGAQMHTSRWDHGIDLHGKRVAVVGTGASAIQVVPAIADQVSQLVLLQRTPPWIIPRGDKNIPLWQQRLLGFVPIAQRAVRNLTMWSRDVQLLSFTRQGRWQAIGAGIARRHLRRQVSDPQLRAAVTPNYAMGCKRVLLSDDYYPALQRSHVVIAPALQRVTATGVVDADGNEIEVDVIVWATGFKVMDPPLADRTIGSTGRTLAEVFYDTHMAAYRGTTVSGFPNLFILQGPNTGLGHSSVVLMTEAQVGYVTQAICSGEVLDVDADRQRAYVNSLDQRLATTVWEQGGCRSWYQDGRGRNIALWPGSTHSFARQMQRFDPDAYHQLHRWESADAEK